MPLLALTRCSACSLSQQKFTGHSSPDLLVTKSKGSARGNQLAVITTNMQTTTLSCRQAFTPDVRRRLRAQKDRPHRKHYLKHLSCRAAPQKVHSHGPTSQKGTQPGWVQRHPNLHMAAEMARHPAGPGLLLTAVAVQGFTLARKVNPST